MATGRISSLNASGGRIQREGKGDIPFRREDFVGTLDESARRKQVTFSEVAEDAPGLHGPRAVNVRLV
jgi:hypothetical protein